MGLLSLFQAPVTLKITGRSSSITNVFVNSILPVILPTEQEMDTALSLLEMTADTFQCAYCGGIASEWDHLRPLIVDKMPTGYITEIHNLVPACGKCNQSKGNKDWKVWMLSDAKLSPKSKGVTDLDDRIARIEKYMNWGTPTKVDLAKVVGEELWDQHMRNLAEVQQLMRQSQELADQIREKVIAEYQADKL